MRITVEQIGQIAAFADMVAGLFPRKKRLRKLGDFLTKLTAFQGPFEDARRKVDQAAAMGLGTTLSIEEAAALDAALDAVSKTAAKVKRALPS